MASIIYPIFNIRHFLEATYIFLKAIDMELEKKIVPDNCEKNEFIVNKRTEYEREYEFLFANITLNIRPHQTAVDFQQNVINLLTKSRELYDDTIDSINANKI